MFTSEIKNFYKGNQAIVKFYEKLIHEKLTKKPQLAKEEYCFDFYEKHKNLLECFEEIINERDWYTLIQNDQFSFLGALYSSDEEYEPDYYVIDDSKYAQCSILSAAIRAGFEILVNFLLTEGVDPNVANTETFMEDVDDFSVPGGGVGSYERMIVHSYPLHEAVQVEREDILQLLLDRGAKRDVINDRGQTPLHVAARTGNLKMIKLLLEYQLAKQAEIYQQTQSDNNNEVSQPINSNAGIILAKSFNVQHYLQQQDNKGYTALHYAAEALADDVISYLRRRSQNQLDDIKNKDKMTALDCTRAIQTKGKDGEFAEINKHKVKAAMDALMANDLQFDKIVQALYTAIDKNNLPHIKSFLTEQPALIESRNSYTNTLLYEAIYSKNVVLAEYFIGEKADVNARCFEGKRPLHIAIKTQAKEIISTLIAAGAEVNAKDDYDATPLLDAARIQNIEIIELLLNHGATIKNVISISGYVISILGYTCNALDQNCLHIAAIDNCHENLAYLFEKSGKETAILGQPDDYGRRPLHYAAELGHKETVELLIKLGATLDSKDNYGRIPLHYAAEKDHIAIVECLLKSENKENIQKTVPVVNRLLSEKEEAADKSSFVSQFEPQSPSPFQHLLVNASIKQINKELVKISFTDIQKAKAFVAELFKIGMGNPRMPDNSRKIEPVFADPTSNSNTQDSYHITLTSAELDALKQTQPITQFNERSQNKQLTDNNNNSLTHDHIDEDQQAQLPQLQVKDKYARTPLHMAVAKGALKTADCLLKKGASLKDLDNKGRTPLHLAARDGQLEMLQFLLGKGADALIKDKKGDTPLDVAHRHDKNYKNKMGKYDEQKYKDACSLLRGAENKYYANKEEKQPTLFSQKSRYTMWESSPQRQSSYARRDGSNINPVRNNQQGGSRADSHDWRKPPNKRW